MKKIVVTGTGRCGTSFLMQLFTALGLNTGYTTEEAEIAIRQIDGLNAGIEHGFDSDRYQVSRIVKNPAFAQVHEMSRIVEGDGVDHVIIPIRKLRQTAASRAKMEKETHGHFGGFWLEAHNSHEQATAHAVLFYNLIEYLTLHSIPFTLLHFPRIISDCSYGYEKLKDIFGFSYSEYEAKHQEIADIEKVRFK